VVSSGNPRAASSLPYTPGRGSWLRLVEGLFSELAQSVLLHVGVSSLELKGRIIAAMDFL
jgi:hypothetical protein